MSSPTIYILRHALSQLIFTAFYSKTTFRSLPHKAVTFVKSYFIGQITHKQFRIYWKVPFFLNEKSALHFSLNYKKTSYNHQK